MEIIFLSLPTYLITKLFIIVLNFFFYLVYFDLSSVKYLKTSL